MLTFHFALWIIILLNGNTNANNKISDEININFGDQLVISCSFNVSEFKILENDFNKLSIAWSKNSTKIQENKHKKQFITFDFQNPILKSNFTINEAFEQDSGVYFCDIVITNPEIKDYILNHTQKTNVIVTDEFKTDRFDIENKNDFYKSIDVKIYNSIIIIPIISIELINSFADKLSTLNVNMYKDFEIYTFPENKSVITDSFRSINLKNCTQFDAGLYSVIVAEGIISKTNISYTVNVLSKPILEILYVHPINPNQVESKWEANCEIYAYPVGEVIWKFTPCHNFQIGFLPLCDYSKTKIIEKFNQNNLRSNSNFSNNLIKYSNIWFTPPSSGIIECKGENSIGKNSVSSNIFIKDVENALNISSSLSLNNINIGDQFNLTCKGLQFFYDLDWYSNENQKLVDSSHELFSDVEVFKESYEFYNTVTLKFNNMKQSHELECRGYKDSKKTAFQSKPIEIKVLKSNSHLYYLLIFIPLIIIIFGILYYYYRKNNKELPWMLLYDEKFEFPVEKIKFEKELGSGAFGVVFEAIAEGILPNEEETIVAIKTIKKSTLNETTLKSLESELEILLSLGKHLNLVNLLGAVTKNPLRYKLMVIVEYCKFGNMKNYLFENRNCFINQIDPKTGILNKNINSQTYDSQYNPMEFTTSTLLLWVYQIACGMAYVSAQKILHGDLAARNILLSDDNIVKICDFGLAKSMSYEYNYQSKGNSPLPIRWLAIETLESGLFSTYSDVWSYGIVLWEFFTLCKDPYDKMSVDRFRLLGHLQNGYRNPKPKFSNNEIYNLMLECWNEDAKKRPTFTDLQNQFKDLIDHNIAEYYIKLNEPYEKENEEKKNAQNSKESDKHLNNIDNNFNNLDITNRKQNYFKNLPASNSLEYTNQQRNENPEVHVNLNNNPIDKKHSLPNESAFNSHVIPVSNNIDYLIILDDENETSANFNRTYEKVNFRQSKTSDNFDFPVNISSKNNIHETIDSTPLTSYNLEMKAIPKP